MRQLLRSGVLLVAAVAAAAQGPATLVTVPFDSALLKARAPINIILPAGYAGSPQRFPVLYLLHGLWGHYGDWAEKTNVLAYASSLPLILVMPEGANGWYTDGVAHGARWEDYLMQEVVPYVDGHYRTLQDARARGIAGLSMGGYGALKLGLKYPQMFSFAGSMSGALEVPGLPDAALGDPQGVLYQSVHAAFGAPDDPARSANSMATLLAAAHGPLPFFYLDCGTEDSLVDSSRRFNQALTARHLPHEYRERPGIHDWAEWDHQIRGVLELVAERWELVRASVSQ